MRSWLPPWLDEYRRFCLQKKGGPSAVAVLLVSNSFATKLSLKIPQYITVPCEISQTLFTISGQWPIFVTIWKHVTQLKSQKKSRPQIRLGVNDFLRARRDSHKQWRCRRLCCCSGISQLLLLLLPSCKHTTTQLTRQQLAATDLLCVPSRLPTAMKTL